MRTYESMQQLKQDNPLWFSHDTMQFFNSCIVTDLIKGRFFVTSERMELDMPKRYTVRKASGYKNIVTVGKMQQYKTLKGAEAAITAILDCEAA